MKTAREKAVAFWKEHISWPLPSTTNDILNELTTLLKEQDRDTRHHFSDKVLQIGRDTEERSIRYDHEPLIKEIHDMIINTHITEGGKQDGEDNK